MLWPVSTVAVEMNVESLVLKGSGKDLGLLGVMYHIVLQNCI